MSDERRASRFITSLALIFTSLLITHHSSLLSPAQAQARFFEPKEGYYGAKGSRVTAEWSVDRTTVREDESLTATLTVRGATNPREVQRPDLRNLPKFSGCFQIEDVPGSPPEADAKEVAFAYRLRPRHREVDGIPSMDFFYRYTAITVGNPYMNARVKGLPITVVAAPPAPKPAAIPLEGPEELFAVKTGREVLRREPFVPGAWGWLLLVLVGPLAAGAWFLAWRRVYPDAARLARLRRVRAVRRVTDSIRRAGRTPEPAAAVAAAVLCYLRTRFPLPPGAETPPEVRESLTAAGLPGTVAGEVEAFLRRCDEARFAPSRDVTVSLAPDAERLIVRLEAVG